MKKLLTAFTASALMIVGFLMNSSDVHASNEVSSDPFAKAKLTEIDRTSYTSRKNKYSINTNDGFGEEYEVTINKVVWNYTFYEISSSKGYSGYYATSYGLIHVQNKDSSTMTISHSSLKSITSSYTRSFGGSIGVEGCFGVSAGVSVSHGGSDAIEDEFAAEISEELLKTAESGKYTLYIADMRADGIIRATTGIGSKKQEKYFWATNFNTSFGIILTKDKPELTYKATEE